MLQERLTIVPIQVGGSRAIATVFDIGSRKGALPGGREPADFRKKSVKEEVTKEGKH